MCPWLRTYMLEPNTKWVWEHQWGAPHGGAAACRVRVRGRGGPGGRPPQRSNTVWWVEWG